MRTSPSCRTSDGRPPMGGHRSYRPAAPIIPVVASVPLVDDETLGWVVLPVDVRPRLFPPDDADDAIAPTTMDGHTPARPHHEHDRTRTESPFHLSGDQTTTPGPCWGAA